VEMNQGLRETCRWLAAELVLVGRSLQSGEDETPREHTEGAHAIMDACGAARGSDVITTGILIALVEFMFRDRTLTAERSFLATLERAIDAVERCGGHPFAEIDPAMWADLRAMRGWDRVNA
jgi:hypothetical protein